MNGETAALRLRLAELQVKEKAMTEGEHQIESLQQELASAREKLSEREVKLVS